MAGGAGDGHDFYVTRSDQQLQRRNNAAGPLGLYCCEVETVASLSVSICVNSELKLTKFSFQQSQILSSL